MEQTASEIFHTLSRELNRLAELTTALQDQLLPRGYDDLEIEALQGLDSINQTLACLATYTARVGAVADCDCTIAILEAADQVSLAALAERLRGIHSKPLPAITEVELF